MTETRLNIIVVLVSMAIGVWALSWWLFSNPAKEFTVHNPGMDNRPDVMSVSAAVNIGAIFSAFDGLTSSIPGEWPRFRGAELDNISKENIKLADSWGDGGPEILWSIDLGEGHAGPVISDGRVYILDYDEEKQADILRCFSFDDGREIWQRGYNIYIKRNHGVSRTVPAVMDQLVVTIGPKCHVMCVDAVNGDFKWGIDLVHEYEAEVPLWYTGQCPLIDESTAVIAVGGSSATWGNFGGQGYLKASVDTALANLNGYSPTVSVENSGISYAANRVQSLVLRRVRLRTSTGEMQEVEVALTVYQQP